MTFKNVENITSSRGKKIANQFIIKTDKGQFFKSYDSVIAFKPNDPMQPIELDCIKWNYSRTTSKYRNIFLNCDTKDIKQMTKNGDLIFINLN
jgi:hypothetical protein